MKNTTELMMIIDKSGSMDHLKEDVIGGFNSLIESQKQEEGETLVTTLLFNHEVSFIHQEEDISKIKPINKRTYSPNGCTAMLDAIGDGIAFLKSKYSKLKQEELPENTIVYIMTDGYENSSKEYSYSQINKMIKMQKKCGWKFIFAGANIDVEVVSDSIGVDKDDAYCFKSTPEGIIENLKCASASISKARKRK